MSMRSTLEKILRRYGSPLILRQGEEETLIHGFMQHNASISQNNIQPAFSPLGEIPRGHHLLLVPPHPLPTTGDFIGLDGKWYVIRRVEKVWYRDEALYCWCLCEEGGKEDTWATQF